ncbi:UNVERIFIED_CONTAM: hypothetical protein H355_014294 [Colinus virginianus]|nr:hypothetical protein H355_014294 [Colinus virginianus]
MLQVPDLPFLCLFVLQARGADIPDITGELPLRTCGSTASMKVKNVKKLSFTKGHFPKMAECAHFHYENVDFGNIQVSFGLLFCVSLVTCCEPGGGGSSSEVGLLMGR